MSAIDDVFARYPEHLTADQLAEALDRGRSTIYAWLRSGQLPSYRRGGIWIIYRDEVLAWVKGGRKCPAATMIDDVFGRYPEHLSVQEVAEAVGVSPTTIYRWLQDGTIPGFQQVGSGNWTIYRDEVLSWMKDGRTPPHRQGD